ncbi:MAG: SulP family inorganic anion transporter [Rhodospirillales bacterium]|jgi:sulfate permease, SulP family|nr:SulP family inorganic anion transporter [Rhodospirillaceae bacterium]MBT5034796.1 SulP family inorganic anion transporter [Rhodospirillaceae bacterium]MBT6218125.1 SulP family inorganic anion transporter [Rhodospirillaceae bacterium]MBT6362857.1 SulP family inorganic anion transporter [Rhodospirillaceae bacterium]MBT8003012.1 SulP family inorganic anion transporter [Rhodospirillales bacterium]
MSKSDSISPYFKPPTVKTAFPFINWIVQVNRQTLVADLLAALTGAVVVLPQGVAFAMIAGLPPQYGLYTAIIVPIVAALFGSSLHLVSGPTTAISIVVFGVVSTLAQPGSTEFITLAFALTLMAGVYQLIFGIVKLGQLANFVSHAVVIGFTAGAAILIAASQLKNVMGIDIPQTTSFISGVLELFSHVLSTNVYALIIAVPTLFTAIIVHKFYPRLPHLLIAIVVGSVIGILLDAPSHGVAMVGELPDDLPPFAVPEISLATIRDLAPGALAVAVLGLIEAVSIARSIASQSHQRIDANQEFVGQGLSNIVGSFFSCYAGSGSFTRSGINYSAGAKTPVAAILAAVFLALMLVFVAPLAAYLPIPAMGAVIFLVAYSLIDFRNIKIILGVSRSDGAVLVVTFCATLLLDLEFAIFAGVLLSLVIYLNHTAHPRVSSIIPNPDASPRRFESVATHSNRRCPQLDVLDVSGSIFFGSSDAIFQRIQVIYKRKPSYRHILIVADSVSLIDVSGAEMLVEVAEVLRERGGGLYISGLGLEDRAFLKRGGYLQEIGRKNVFYNKKRALPAIIDRLNLEQCAICQRRIFLECPEF